MTRPSLVNTALFWLMLLLGTAALAPCLVLPAWLERQAQLECLRARAAYLEALQQRLQVVRKQIEHVNDDPAYVLRLAEQDFGNAIKVPEVETIWIDNGPAPGETSAPQQRSPTVSAGAAPELWPELGVFVERAMQRYPQAHLFVDERTRPWLMGTGGMLILAGIVLLGAGANRPEDTARGGIRTRTGRPART